MKASMRGVFIRLIAAIRVTGFSTHLFLYTRFLTDYNASDMRDI